MIGVPEVAGTIQRNFADKWGLDNQHVDAGCPNFVAHALRAEGHDASEDETGRGTPLVFDPVNITSKANRSVVEPGRECHTLHKGGAPAIAYSVCLGSDPIHNAELAMPQTSRNGDPGVVAFALGSAHRTTHAPLRSGVRRLTPRECERLQGFPDDYTLITYRKKPAADAPRYRALGNSMAVNVMRWIFRRIEMVQALTPKG